MSQIKMYCNNMVKARTKKNNTSVLMIKTILIYLTVALSAVLLRYLLHIKNHDINELLNYTNFNYGINVFFCIIFFYLIRSKIQEFQVSEENEFLRSLGFNARLMFLVVLIKQYFLFLEFAFIYFLINWSFSASGMAFFFKIILSQLLLFLTIFILAIILNIIENRFTNIVKSIIIITVLLFCEDSFVNFKLQQIGINKDGQFFLTIVDIIGKNKVILFLANHVIFFNTIQLLLLLISLCVFLFITNEKASFYDTVAKSKENHNSRSLFNAINIKSNNPVISFIKRDILLLFRKKTFILVQIVFTLIFVLLHLGLPIITLATEITFMSVFVFFNTFLVEDLFKIDLWFQSLYAMSPIKYSAFAVSKLVSLFIVSSMVPIIILLTQMLVNTLHFDMFLISFLFIWLFAAFLSLYFTSAMLFFYPEIRYMGIPMLICILMLPILPISISIIFIGLRRGKKKWLRRVS